MKTIKIKKTSTGLDQKDKALIRNMVENSSLMRSSLLNKLIDSRRDIDDECGYPKELTVEQYKIMYDREGIATRVVSLYSEESWVHDPEIIETEDPEETEFEKAWKNLDNTRQIISYMMKGDELSGIGTFGIILLGINDGKTLDQPVEGINERGEKTGTVQYELIYLRTFDESSVRVEKSEMDQTNPRFGKPVLYSVAFESTNMTRIFDTGKTKVSTSQQHIIHWTRIIHLADNRKSSEVYGVPRMQTLFNRLYDIRKISGGSAEMFWKGGFPGYSFEMDPNAKAPTTAEQETMRDAITEYANGLQRYIRLQGVKVNSLAPQVADPRNHVEIQLELIAIALGVPKRIFMGAEQAKLASTQDQESWNKKVARRQKKYLTPYIVRPMIDRLIAFGILPEVEDYRVEWPDLNTESDQDKATTLRTQVEAYAKYVGGGVDSLIPPEEFLSMLAGFTPDQIKQIIKSSLERQEELEDQELEDQELDKAERKEKEEEPEVKEEKE